MEFRTFSASERGGIRIPSVLSFDLLAANQSIIMRIDAKGLNHVSFRIACGQRNSGSDDCYGFQYLPSDNHVRWGETPCFVYRTATSGRADP